MTEVSNGASIISKARAIAEKAHAMQVRKTDGTPYIVHPLAVADIVKAYGFSDEVVAAALVHDVLEDTGMSETDLRAELGDKVVDIVTAVSEDKSLPWEERKARYVEAVAAASEGIKAVSVADKIHNAQSLIAGYETHGPTIWTKFNRGKDKKLWFENLLYATLKERWSHPLMDEYGQMIERLQSLSD